MPLPYLFHQYYPYSNQIPHLVIDRNILSIFTLSSFPPLWFSHPPPLLRLLVSVSEVSVSEPIPWYRYRYRLYPVSVPIPVNFTVVILQVISLFIILTVQYVIIIITY